MRRDVIITALLTFCLTATLFMVATSRSQEYDPWADLNEDGIVDIFDVVGVTGIYETTGDSTKNVNVTNWPESTTVTVWFGYSVSDGGLAVSGTAHANGFSKLHMLIRAHNLGGLETIEFTVWGHLWNEAHSAYQGTRAYNQTLTSTDSTAAVSIDVPCEDFHFSFDAASGTACTIYLSYYLTWA